MKIVSLALGVMLFAGCGGGGTPATTPPTTETSATVFELGELTLVEADTPMLKIHADGSTELGYRSGALTIEAGQTASSDSLPVSYKPGPTIQADGTFVHEGAAVIRLDADGSIMNLATNEKLSGVLVTADQITITREGSMAGVTFAVAADGVVTITGAQPGASTKPMRIEGADSPGKRRAMLTLIALSVGGGLEEAPEPMQGSGAAPVLTP